MSSNSDNQETLAEQPAPANVPDAPVLPHATERDQSDDKPPLYVSGWGVMGQSTPDVATGSTPVTRKDDL